MTGRSPGSRVLMDRYLPGFPVVFERNTFRLQLRVQRRNFIDFPFHLASKAPVTLGPLDVMGA
ncbi:MAG: hypothetical protein RIS52_2384 [Pseudomonadota bacterium]|jgi:hypothetical protein